MFYTLAKSFILFYFYVQHIAEKEKRLTELQKQQTELQKQQTELQNRVGVIVSAFIYVLHLGQEFHFILFLCAAHSREREKAD